MRKHCLVDVSCERLAEMEACEVSTAVGNPTNNLAECVKHGDS